MHLGLFPHGRGSCGKGMGIKMAREKDVEIKIPKWYMKLPISVMESVSELAARFIKIFPAKKRKKGDCKVKFYI